MPVTAKLSQKFYETFGDEIANELVEWFNAVDATYRADLRDLNELNFSRFDAKLEQRLADSDARWERRISALDSKWERRMAELDAKWNGRMTELDAKWDGRITELDAKWDGRITEFDAKWERHLGEFRTEMQAIKAELIKWTFVFIAGGTLTVLGAAAALLKL